MVNWTSPQELATDAKAFNNLIHCLLGLYIWEWATSLDFDLLFITGKEKFKWPRTFYFLNRYCLLFALVGIAIALNVSSEINCQHLYTFNQCFGNAAIGLASINLSLRTMAVWHRDWKITCPLVLVILGHWSLLLHGILLKAEWIDGQCVITETNNTLLAATFIYSMVFDFVVLLLTAYKLVYSTPVRLRDLKKNDLTKIIFQDGLIYFIVAFIVNLIATVFMLLNLNPVMSIIANVPAAICSTIVACRITRRLVEHKHERLYPNTAGNSTAGFEFSNKAQVLSKVTTTTRTEGVHVQMDTFAESPVDKNVYADYNAATTKSVLYDSEAQATDFKTPY